MNPETRIHDYPFLPDGVAVRTVSQLTQEVRDILEPGFMSVWVEGEITNFNRHSSGICYFSLADAHAILKAVMFKTQALRLPAGFEPRVGDAVVAAGRIGVYAQHGVYQLYVERMFPKGGLGAAELALRNLKEKLQRLGYFDPKRKKPLRAFPRTLCLIASPTGAAVRDMIEILRQRWPATTVLVVPSRVQGDGAAEEIAANIDRVNGYKSHVDGILIGRGGGSSEDLAAFNTEVVATAIYQSKIPIISAVGHEIDITIADLVADARASTPSNAAEMAVPDRAVVGENVADLSTRLGQAVRRQIKLLRRQLDALAKSRVFLRPRDRLLDLQQRLDDQGDRLQRAMWLRAERLRREVENVAARLESLSPLNVLARGYSLTRKEADATLLRSADQVRPDDRLVTALRHGTIISRVESTQPDAERHG